MAMPRKTAFDLIEKYKKANGSANIFVVIQRKCREHYTRRSVCVLRLLRYSLSLQLRSTSLKLQVKHAKISFSATTGLRNAVAFLSIIETKAILKAGRTHVTRFFKYLQCEITLIGLCALP